MTQLNETQIIQAAQILTDSIPIGWPTLQDALDEINRLMIPENTLLAAIENGIVLGWGGILPSITEMSSNCIRWLFAATGASKALAGNSCSIGG